MLTLQMLQEVGTVDKDRIDFVAYIISSHKLDPDYKLAEIAQEYDAKRNVTITQYKKLLYTISGQTVPDNYSANYKLYSNFFNRLVTQQNQYLLGNGVSFDNARTKDKLGKDFDTRLQEAGRDALVDKVSFGFWNQDHLEIFRFTEFAPLYDEYNGALSAGVRFWQIDSNKPLRATLYEMDGYTDYIWEDGEGRIYKPKRAYKLKVRHSEIDGEQIYDGENYPAFPIVPLWGNPQHQSELVGIREQIDCYDLIKSGFANDIDDTSLIYWTISNAGAMDDIDMATFLQRLKTIKGAAVEGTGQVQAHTMDIPFASRETLLDRLRNDIYDDFMGLDTRRISTSAATATEIKASYEPMDNKVNQFEYCVLEFLDGILAVAGFEDDNPIFTRSRLINVQEEMQIVLQTAQFLPQEYITEKLLTLLGDIDRLDEIKEKMEEETIEKMNMMMGGGLDGSGAQADGEETEEA